MLAQEVLDQLNLGNSVAEFDEALERYFVETQTFRALIRDEADIIAGDKGTGKTALFKILQDRYREIPELEDVEVIAAFNPAGNPVFQRLTYGEPMEEGQYITLWKGYVLALVGNWILKVFEGAYSDSMFELDALLTKVGLRSPDDSPSTVFSQIVNLFRRITNPKAVEVAVTISPSGLPIVIPRIELGDAEDSKGRPLAIEVPHDESLALLDKVLDELGLTAWIALDRLDEAFQGFPAAEVPALRALLRTYLDLTGFSRIRLKLFLRKDLFRRIIAGGFVNLTHVNARKMEIVWEEDDLYDLLIRRIRESGGFLAAIGSEDANRGELFAKLFPAQVDPGKRKPSTWRWMMSRIRDGNSLKPPRNLIDLVKKSQEGQLRREEADKVEFDRSRSLLRPEALKQGLSRLSKERVEDTLLAEAGEHAPLIERFRAGKAEHNRETITEILALPPDAVAESIRMLVEIGFLEEVGDTFKIPILYREGREITQGKAFALGAEPDEDE